MSRQRKQCQIVRAPRVEVLDEIQLPEKSGLEFPARPLGVAYPVEQRPPVSREVVYVLDQRLPPAPVAQPSPWRSVWMVCVLAIVIAATVVLTLWVLGFMGDGPVAMPWDTQAEQLRRAR